MDLRIHYVHSEDARDPQRERKARENQTRERERERGGEREGGREREKRGRKQMGVIMATFILSSGAQSPTTFTLSPPTVIHTHTHTHTH